MSHKLVSSSLLVTDEGGGVLIMACLDERREGVELYVEGYAPPRPFSVLKCLENTVLVWEEGRGYYH